MEQKAMGTAMQESLVEAEAQKLLERPVHEQSDEQLKSRYERSYILEQVDLVLYSILCTSDNASDNHILSFISNDVIECKSHPFTERKSAQPFKYAHTL